MGCGVAFIGLQGGWLVHPGVRWPLTALYLGVLLLISIYGLHRYWLVWLYYRHERRVPRPAGRFDSPPAITVQLPLYNEAAVAARVIDAACRLEYPRDRLQVQVLDDSTDGSTAIARSRVEHWAARGVDIQWLRRPDRTGYKAGALADALPQAKGRFIAVFDADFVPEPDFLNRTVHYFTDPRVGMVQARWDHLNRDDSLLTRCQAVFLDGHFVVEHTARNRSGRWINFNGTAGVWRREAIEAAGGWQHDTLTEDVDLSYRAQLAGWEFVYLPGVRCPAELPPEVNAFKAQQHRWTKGSIQVARKLLPTIWRSDAPLRVKVESFFHLTGPMVYLYVTLMALLFYPAFYVNTQPFEPGSAASIVLGMSLFALGTASAGVFYVVSQRRLGRGMSGTLLRIPALMSIGVGIALNNARGCIEALAGHQSEFVRTPKYSADPREAGGRASRPRRGVIPTPSIKSWMIGLELGMGLYCLECIRLAMRSDHAIISVPFLLLFAGGYLYVGINSLVSRRLAARAVGATEYYPHHEASIISVAHLDPTCAQRQNRQNMAIFGFHAPNR